jgi:serine/threonine protein kinase
MELCPYPSLEAILKKRGFLNESKVRRIMKNILDTVSYIHSCHVCHRDLKPDNLLVDEKTGAIKIIDFGVSS